MADSSPASSSCAESRQADVSAAVGYPALHLNSDAERELRARNISEQSHPDALAYFYNWPKAAAHAVSLKKRRFVDSCAPGGSIDLDLAYITDQIIAMGFPAVGWETWYRNSRSETLRFLTDRHAAQFLVVNSCVEPQRQYDPAVFFHRVVNCQFKDHYPPQLHQLFPAMYRLHAWMQQNPDAVVAVHCKAGKGRTGTLICCLLIHAGSYQRADDAMAFYGIRRTFNGKGVTIPSQRRYVQYYSWQCAAIRAAMAASADTHEIVDAEDEHGSLERLPQLRMPFTFGPWLAGTDPRDVPQPRLLLTSVALALPWRAREGGTLIVRVLQGNPSTGGELVAHTGLPGLHPKLGRSKATLRPTVEYEPLAEAAAVWSTQAATCDLESEFIPSSTQLHTPATPALHPPFTVEQLGERAVIWTGEDLAAHTTVSTDDLADAWQQPGVAVQGDVCIEIWQADVDAAGSLSREIKLGHAWVHTAMLPCSGDVEVADSTSAGGEHASEAPEEKEAGATATEGGGSSPTTAEAGSAESPPSPTAACSTEVTVAVSSGVLEPGLQLPADTESSAGASGSSSEADIAIPPRARGHLCIPRHGIDGAQKVVKKFHVLAKHQAMLLTYSAL